jgi:4-hydroxy-3-polyprenylbenzoate decarboxylase
MGAGDFKTVSAKVAPDGEIQEIARQLSATGGPAVLFDNIEGHEDTWCTKLMVASLNTFGKVARALGMPPETPMPLLAGKMQQALKNPMTPIVVETGPVKENIIKDNIDINEIPVPKWHPKDGGRYINLWHGVVTKDPDTGEHNIGCYRGQIADRDTIVSLLVKSQGWGRHYAKYCERGEDMPVAFFYGVDPTLMIAAGSPLTTNGVWGEYEWAGAMAGQSVPIVKCETHDIYVPARAEIVVEGFVSKDEKDYLQEGPFKEASAVYSVPELRPAMKVSCITHRDDPIFTGTATGTAPVLEEQFIPAIPATTAVLKNHLDNAGIPYVDLTLAPIFAVKIKKMWQGHPLQVAYTLLGHKSSNLPINMLVVVEDNVNIYEPGEVLKAINNNADPVEDVYSLPVDNQIYSVAMSDGDCNTTDYGASLGNKLFIDATVNWKRHPKKESLGGARIPPTEPPVAEDVEKVRRRWNEYGLEDIQL